MGINGYFFIWLFLCLNLIFGCSSKGLAPLEDKNFSSFKSIQVLRRGVIENPGKYKVLKGDSLYAIAWRFGVDHQELLEINDIVNKNLIFEGQILRLRGGQKLLSKTPTNLQSKTKQSPEVSPILAKENWKWPVDGEFKEINDGNRLIGLEIYGTEGEEVRSAASGTVVYSGNGLRGYGELVIVKHSEALLSAYAHNKKRVVEEGDIVEVSEVIGLMGSTGVSRNMLYFEIRKNGKSVNPFIYLPEI